MTFPNIISLPQEAQFKGRLYELVFVISALHSYVRYGIILGRPRATIPTEYLCIGAYRA